jgi:hypothetical protein
MGYNVCNMGTHLLVQWAPSDNPSVLIPKKDVVLGLTANGVYLNAPDVGPGVENFNLDLTSTVGGESYNSLPELRDAILALIIKGSAPDYMFEEEGVYMFYKIGTSWDYVYDTGDVDENDQPIMGTETLEGKYFVLHIVSNMNHRYAIGHMDYYDALTYTQYPPNLY